MYLELIRQWIIQHKGIPPGAEQLPGLSPPTYWWEFFPGWWMRFAVVARRKWFRVVAREVLVIGIQNSPPRL
jgi:hypothetical protein